MAKKNKKKKEEIEIEVDTSDAPFDIPEMETVIWEDHNSVDAWQDAETYQPYPVVVVSTGFVVYEDEDIISLANTFSVDSGFCCIINILKRCIIG